MRSLDQSRCYARGDARLLPLRYAGGKEGLRPLIAKDGVIETLEGMGLEVEGPAER
jgi:hypothetical protein